MKISKRGAAILESSIILPLVISVVMSLITFDLLLFNFVLEKSKLDDRVRIYSNSVSKTLSFPDSKESTTVDSKLILTDGLPIYKKIALESNESYKSKMFSSLNLKRNEKSEATIFDESNFIRNINLISEGLNIAINKKSE